MPNNTTTDEKSVDGGHPCPSCDRVLPTEHGLKQHHFRIHDESLVGIVEVECEQCGKQFGKYKSKIRDGQDTFFCSKDCEWEWQRSQRPAAECSNCGKSLSLPPSETKRKDNNFCDNECYQEWNSSETVKLECECCGDVIEREHYRVERSENHFCSVDCRSKWFSENWVGESHPAWNHATTNCQYCGDKISRPKSQIDVAEKNFCDATCHAKWVEDNLHGERHPNWEGGDLDYGTGWTERKREKVRERDGRECQICGMTGSEHQNRHNKRLHVHHLVKARNFDDPQKRNDVDNLITLCLSCHNSWERIAPLVPDVV